MPREQVIRIFLGLSVGLWILSLLFPTFSTGWPGWGVVLIGWVSFQSPWLANPLLIVSWVAITRRSGGLACAMAIPAFLLAGSFFFWDTVISGSGPDYVIKKLYLGYWLWFLSTIAALVSASALVGRRQVSKVFD